MVNYSDRLRTHWIDVDNTTSEYPTDFVGTGSTTAGNSIIANEEVYLVGYMMLISAADAITIENHSGGSDFVFTPAATVVAGEVHDLFGVHIGKGLRVKTAAGTTTIRLFYRLGG